MRRRLAVRCSRLSHPSPASPGGGGLLLRALVGRRDAASNLGQKRVPVGMAGRGAGALSPRQISKLLCHFSLNFVEQFAGVHLIEPSFLHANSDGTEGRGPLLLALRVSPFIRT